jgi:hypothetical protein
VEQPSERGFVGSHERSLDDNIDGCQCVMGLDRTKDGCPFPIADWRMGTVTFASPGYFGHTFGFRDPEAPCYSKATNASSSN